MTKPKGTLTLQVFSLILMTDVLESCTQLFFKKGAMASGFDDVTLHTFLPFISKVLLSGNLWIGIFCYVLNFFIWMAVLSQVDLSVAFPVGSTSHIWVPFLAVLFLGEKISLLRWLGIIFIIVGICFIQKSTRTQVEKS